ncbi:hypothetical protein [Cyclonatronum proteinivorum]|uniref:hypothetical protein n=1 Tax=Cyclonatronum proteinivorum TaxID=1457365 RepID=UPI000F53E09E|nr:hypothetical protein [Cyclonatronum proteinivorum]
MVILLVSAVLIAAVPQRMQAQDGTIADTNIRLYTLQGNMSLQTHAYSTTRVAGFREPLGMLASMNLNYSLLGFRSGMSVRYSTENSQFRQSMNRVSFRAGWRWIDVAAGDVNPTFNRFSLRGLNVRGGEVQLSPGSFSTHFVFGRVNKKVDAFGDADFRTLSYERWLYGTRLRFGSESRSHFGLGVVYAIDRDDELVPSAQSGDNFAFAGRIPVPEENLTISPDFRLMMFGNRVEMRAENTVSVFTRDTRSEALDLSEAGIPDFVSGLYRVRTSTRANFATLINTRFNFNPLTLAVGFERVQPGFRSLGLRNIKDDDQSLSIQPQLMLLSGRLGISSSLRFGRDNLLNQRVSTLYRNDMAVNVQAQLSPELSLAGGYNVLINSARNTGTADDDTLLNYPEQTIISHNFSLQPSYTWVASSSTHSFSVSAMYQALNIDIDRIDRDLNSSFFTTSFSYNLSVFSGFSLNGGVNYAGGSSPGSDFSVTGLTVGLGHAFFDRKVNVNLNGGLSQNTTESDFGDQTLRQSQRQLNGNASAIYRPARQSTIRLTARTVSNTQIQGTGMGFQEFEVRIIIDQRF